MGKHSLLPILIGVVDVPLLAEADDADIAGTRHHVASRFVVEQRVTVVDEFLSDEVLGLCDFGALEVADDHGALVEALLVGLVLGLLQQFLVVLRLDLQLLAEGDRSEVSVGGRMDQFNRLQIHHLFGDAVLLAEGFFVPEVAGGHPIIGGVAGDAGDDSGSFLHGDGHHGQDVDSLVDCVGGGEGKAHQFLALEDIDYLHFFVLFRQALVSHIES